MKTVVIFFLITGIISCKKDPVSSAGQVEIYLLKDMQMVSGKCQVESAALEPQALVKNDDILGYSPIEHQFRIKDTAAGKVKVLKDGTPFALTVNQKVVYFGFFKPGYSSSSCAHSITMDTPFNDKISLRLGYPGVIKGITVDDRRNDPKLISILDAQGKLD